MTQPKFMRQLKKDLTKMIDKVIGHGGQIQVQIKLINITSLYGHCNLVFESWGNEMMSYEKSSCG